MNSIRKIGYAQFFPEFGEVQKNLEIVATLVRSTEGADLIVLPELATTGYEILDTEELATFAETFNSGPTSEHMLALARETETTLVIGYAERAGDRFFNSAMLATPDGRLTNYRKIQLFDRENDLFSPGDIEPCVVDTPAGRIGMMICFDWTFPEIARILTLRGAQIIAHPSNLVMPYCQRAMFARCLENGVYAVTANRVGVEERVGRRIQFTGMSQITGHRGDVLHRASADEQEVGIVAIDLTLADDKSYNSYNHRIHDRRIDLYGELLKEPE